MTLNSDTAVESCMGASQVPAAARPMQSAPIKEPSRTRIMVGWLRLAASDSVCELLCTDSDSEWVRTRPAGCDIYTVVALMLPALRRLATDPAVTQ